jgi:hypothetical protein
LGYPVIFFAHVWPIDQHQALEVYAELFKARAGGLFVEPRYAVVSKKTAL